MSNRKRGKVGPEIESELPREYNFRKLSCLDCIEGLLNTLFVLKIFLWLT